MDINGLGHLSSAKWQASRYAILVLTYVQTRLMLVSNFDITTVFFTFFNYYNCKRVCITGPDRSSKQICRDVAAGSNVINIL
jgi:hypothetical protein